MGAPAARVYECAREWVAAGHRVTVLTGMPHHPTGVVPPRYRGRCFLRERVDGIDVVRAYVYAAPNRGVCRRAYSYFSFMVASVVTGFLTVRRPDVLIATSPQLLAGVAGALLAFLKRVPFVFEVRDLWPESIEAVGALRSRLLLAPLYRAAAMLYRRARLIVLVSESSRDALAARGVSSDKMAVVKNGVDLTLFHPQLRENHVRKRHGLGDSFTVLYIGTLGMAHGLEVVLEAARRLAGGADVRFVLVGEGARKNALRRRAQDLPNVTFVDGRPRRDVPDYVAASDACLVHLIASDLFKTVLPSKIFEIMGCARPILLGVDGEARRLVEEEARAGIAFAPEDGAALARAVLQLRDDRALARKLGDNGRRFVERHCSRRMLARRYAALLGAVV